MILGPWINIVQIDARLQKMDLKLKQPKNNNCIVCPKQNPAFSFVFSFLPAVICCENWERMRFSVENPMFKWKNVIFREQ